MASSEIPWQHETPVPLQSGVLRLTAPNPGMMTGPGTNSYLVGDANSGFIVIDPGPADSAHMERLWQAATHPQGSSGTGGTGGNIRAIVCTHSHPDHAPGAAALQALCQTKSEAKASTAKPPAILGMPSTATSRADSVFVPDQPLGHLSEIPHGSHSLLAIHTPGHASNHICLLLREAGILFSGDHILQGTTPVIDPPDGNMSDYLDSLDTLSKVCKRHKVSTILPAHGAPLQPALDVIAALKAHRLRREAKVLAAMQALPHAGPDQWVEHAYDDVPAQLWPLAKRSMAAHVARIVMLNGEGERLSKRVMALAGCSRSEAENYIEGGWVRVDGKVADSPAMRVLHQQVALDPAAVLEQHPDVTLILHKPAGWMDGLDAQEAQVGHGPQERPQKRAAARRPDARDLLQPQHHSASDNGATRILPRHFARLQAMVPLEQGASGLVVFTQDWRCARKLSVELSSMEHELMVEVRGEISELALQKLGKLLDGSLHRDRPPLPATRFSVSSSKAYGSQVVSQLRLAVKGAHPGFAGWLCEQAGLEMTGLRRLRLGRVQLGPLASGQWRYLSPAEKF